MSRPFRIILSAALIAAGVNAQQQGGVSATSAAPTAATATPADEIEILDMDPQALKDADTIMPNHSVLQVDQARKLIQATLGKDNQHNYVDDKTFYCIIHVVEWNKDSTTTPADVSTSKWYVFRGGPGVNVMMFDKRPWQQGDLEGVRIYGSKNVGLLTVHWVQAVVPPTDATEKGRFDDNRGLGFKDAKGRALVRIGDETYAQNFPPAPSAKLRYELDVNQKIPAPFRNLFDALALAQGTTQETRLQNKTVAVWTGAVYQLRYNPCDIVVIARVGEKQNEIGRQTFNDEGNYHFDFGAAIPIRSTKQLQYSNTNGTLTATAVDKHTVYAITDIFFKPMDVSKGYTIWPPSIVLGVGLTGKPFDRTMAGIGFGMGKVNGFIGCAFNHITGPTATSGSAATQKIDRWDEKLTFGLNVTFKQLSGLLKNGSKK